MSQLSTRPKPFPKKNRHKAVFFRTNFQNQYDDTPKASRQSALSSVARLVQNFACIAIKQSTGKPFFGKYSGYYLQIGRFQIGTDVIFLRDMFAYCCSPDLGLSTSPIKRRIGSPVDTPNSGQVAAVVHIV